METVVATGRVGRRFVAASAICAGALAAHNLVNLRHIRKPRPGVVDDTVSILIPARNEAHRIGPTIASLVNQDCDAIIEIVVLDDQSTDDTAAVVQEAAAGDPRVRVVSGQPLPEGWLGKPWACEQLGRIATGSVLMFTDADVVFEPHAVTATVSTMRDADLALLSPYPRQIAITWAERLVQPMVTWSWATALPVRVAERSLRPSLSAANGQFIVVDREAYRAAGGHASVMNAVIEDILLLRAVKNAGYRGVAANGSELASCRMYSSAEDVINGYTKSLWFAFGTKSGAVGAVSGIAFMYVLPAAAMLLAKDRRTRAYGALGYAAGVTSRYATARSFGERPLPDVLAHPVMMSAVGALTAASWYRKARGRLSWKDRSL